MDSLEGTPFQRTSLFRTVMAVLAQHLDNSSFPSSAASSESSWGEESRLFAIISVGVVFAILTSVGNLMVSLLSSHSSLPGDGLVQDRQAVADDQQLLSLLFSSRRHHNRRVRGRLKDGDVACAAEGDSSFQASSPFPS